MYAPESPKGPPARPQKYCAAQKVPMLDSRPLHSIPIRQTIVQQGARSTPATPSNGVPPGWCSVARPSNAGTALYRRQPGAMQARRVMDARHARDLNSTPKPPTIAPNMDKTPGQASLPKKFAQATEPPGQTSPQKYVCAGQVSF